MSWPFVPDEVLPSEGNAPHHYRLEIPRGAREWLNENRDHELHWGRRARLVSQWRSIAGWRARRVLRLTEPIRRARVVGELRFCDMRRRDPSNWAPTAKAVLDGLVDAGVFPDDSSKYVTGPDMRLGPAVPRGSEVLIIHIWRLGL